MILILFLVLLDQLTKYIVYKYLMPVNELKLIDNFFNFTYVENRGIAFGMFQGRRWIFVIITIIILIVLFKYYKTLSNNKEDKLIKFSIILISSGAIGNFIDRFFFGYVKDFLNFCLIKFPVFNVADIYVVLGTLLYIIVTIFFMNTEIKKDKI